MLNLLNLLNTKGLGASSFGGIVYLLNDNFTTDLDAGGVNGTNAEPTGGARVVVDTNSKMSISGGKLVVVTGGVASGNPGLWYSTPFTRSPGLMLIGNLIYDSAVGFQMGFDTTQSGASTTSINASSLTIRCTTNSGTLQISIGTIAGLTSYSFAIITRASGAIFLVKGGTYTNWTLLWVDATNSTSTLYANISANSSINGWSSNFIRVPTSLWLPTPLASDGFGSAFGTTDGLGHAETSGVGSGGLGLTWSNTNSVWSVSTGKAINTPNLGSEVVTNSEFTTDTSSWSAANSATLTRRDFATSPNIAPTGGSDNFGLEVAGGGVISGAAIITPTVVANTWYMFSARVYTPSTNTVANAGGLLVNGANFTLVTTTTNNAWTTLRVVGRFNTTSGDFRLRTNSSTAGDKAYFDLVSIKPMTLNELLSGIQTSVADVVSDVSVVVTSGTQAGLCLSLDSTSSPANFVLVYHDGTNVKVDKCVAGTYTNVSSNAATYSSGAVLRVAKLGTTYRVYYNNALVGSSNTISDAGIISNTYHGLFSTYSANTLDNFVVYASTASEFESVLNNYIT